MSDQRTQYIPIGFFDGRANSDFFLIDVDGTIVHVKVDLPTHGVTDGGVRYACRIADRLFEARAKDVESARRSVPLNVRAWRRAMGLRADVPTIGAWKRLGQLEEAVPCVGCGAPSGDPCRDGDTPLTTSGGRAIVNGAPWHPDRHEVDVPPRALVHATRIVAYDRALRGGGRA